MTLSPLIEWKELEVWRIIEDIVVGKKAVKEKWAVVVDMRLILLFLTE